MSHRLYYTVLALMTFVAGCAQQQQDDSLSLNAFDKECQTCVTTLESRQNAQRTLTEAEIEQECAQNVANNKQQNVQRTLEKIKDCLSKEIKNKQNSDERKKLETDLKNIQKSQHLFEDFTAKYQILQGSLYGGRAYSYHLYRAQYDLWEMRHQHLSLYARDFNLKIQ